MSRLLNALALSFALAGILIAADRASAGCGDDVNGQRVPCRCGDVVVSDTRLQPSDPVVAERCPTNGLVLRARRGAETIRLDLAGLTLRGSGHGTGIRVLDGGAQGATIVGGEGRRADVVGFGTGLRARGQRSVRELRDVSFTANARDGVTLRGADTDVVGVSAERNGRDGMRVGGRGTRLEGVDAQLNARYGLRVTSPGASVGAAVAAGNEKGQVRARRAERGTEEERTR
jgi:hypothetical protein